MKTARWPRFDRDDIAAVTRVLRSGKVNQWTGSEVFAFEREYARSLGVRHAVALANGSVALDLALTVLGIGPGDEVIVPCRTFVASASCVALRGATPVFADVDPETQNLTPETVRRVMSRRTRAVIAVHLAGWPCRVDELRRLCGKAGAFLIEDCAQAHGARYKGRDVGTFGHFGAFSFCQDKIISTGGEGGLLVTNDRRLWELARRYKDHGKDFAEVSRPGAPYAFRWLVKSFGTNYRMTEMQAAIGRLALTKLAGWVARRRRFAAMLDDAFERIPALRVARPPAEARHAYYKYYVFVRPDRLKRGWSRDAILKRLLKDGVACGSGTCPEVYREKAFRGAGRRYAGYAAEELGRTSLMFQVHPTLRERDVRGLIERVRAVMGEASK